MAQAEDSRSWKKGETAEGVEGRRFRVSQTTLLGRSQNMLRTVTAVERYRCMEYDILRRIVVCYAMSAPGKRCSWHFYILFTFRKDMRR